MSHEILKNRVSHPARDAAIKSIEATQVGDAGKVLSLPYQHDRLPNNRSFCNSVYTAV